MKLKVEIISASAGSGKTTRLAQLLEEAVENGSARPDAVLATTFTNKAAAELRQRVRTTLLAGGHPEEAQQLTGARIGTVNSVCGQLVSEFAFELGLSPELEVLDEVSAQVALRRALTRAVTEAEAHELEALRERMIELDWQKTVGQIVDRARANAIGPEALEPCRERSTKGFLALLGPRAGDGDALDDALRDALREFVSAAKRSGDPTKTTARSVERAELALRTLDAKGRLPWAEWLALEGLDVAVKSRDLLQPLREAAAAHDVHPALHDDCARAIELCFSIAERALTAYAQYKVEWGAIDFVDQEVLALELLRRDDVRERLRDQLDLVLIDEFQDTSPIQLAIFLALADLAKRSIWVGDQKQSIFAFRGTDPALMDAALEQLLGKREPETLRHSRRSRPALVELASDVFTRAFTEQGLTEARVRLSHPDGKEPKGLGPVLEYHHLKSKNAGQDLAALADGVAQLLADPTVKVRDRATGKAREVRADDVAMLCKTNDDCLGLAGALAARGIPSVVPRFGLMETLEARLMVAGLRLLVDERDSLAAAVLARILESPTDGDALLHALLKGAPLADHDFARRLAAARKAHGSSGPLAAFDLVSEALELPARCAAWGNTAQRLANLDALRAHAVGYVQGALAQGAGCTAAGLVEHLHELSASGEDARATLTEGEAVTLSTWHRAKGLEWPIVVLHGSWHTGSALGVHVENTAKTIDIGAPLEGRWIRFWPTPYQRSQKKAPFHLRLAESTEEQSARENETRQQLRILYVGWTRARDRLVLTGRTHSLTSGMNALLEQDGASLLGELGAVDSAGTGKVEIAGRSVRLRVREAEPVGGETREPEPGVFHPARTAWEGPAAFVAPSGREGSSEVLRTEALGERLAVSGGPEMQRLGEAVHGFLAAEPGLKARGERESLAKEILERWGVLGCVRPEALVAAADRLRGWANQWPEARWHREYPLYARRADGTVVRGAADLVLETSAEWIVVDHKSFPGTRAEGEARARGHGGQLRAYAEALESHVKKPVRGFIHLPLLGRMLELDLSPEAATSRARKAQGTRKRS